MSTHATTPSPHLRQLQEINTIPAFDAGKVSPRLRADGSCTWLTSNTLALAGNDGHVYVWDVRTEHATRSIRRAVGTGNPLEWVLWGRGDDHVFIGGAQSPIMMWGIGGHELRRIPHAAGNRHAALSPDGTALVEVGSGVATHTLSPLYAVRHQPTTGARKSASWSPDGSVCLAPGSTSIVAVPGTRTHTHGHVGDTKITLYSHIAWHPNGSMFVVDTGHGDLELRRKTGDLMDRMCGRASGITHIEHLAWSPDGATVAALAHTIDGERRIKLVKVV